MTFDWICELRHEHTLADIEMVLTECVPDVIFSIPQDFGSIVLTDEQHQTLVHLVPCTGEVPPEEASRLGVSSHEPAPWWLEIVGFEEDVTRRTALSFAQRLRVSVTCLAA